MKAIFATCYSGRAAKNLWKSLSCGIAAIKRSIRRNAQIEPRITDVYVTCSDLMNVIFASQYENEQEQSLSLSL